MRTHLRAITTSVLSFAAGASASAQSYYRLVDLGHLNVNGETWASAVDNHNRVAAFSLYNPSSRLTAGVVIDAGVATDLGRFFGGDWAWAWDVNDAGRVVGVSYKNLNFDIGPRGFVWENGALIQVGALAAGNTTAVYAVNAAGDLAGFATPNSTTGLNTFHACRWAANNPDGAPTDLGTLGGVNSFAYGINDLGDVVGAAELSAGPIHACHWAAGGAKIDLGTLGGPGSEARAVNNAGQIVGWAHTPDGTPHAFIHQNGSMTSLGALGGSSHADDINQRGDVVGSAWVPGRGPRAFVCPAGGRVTNLNNRVAELGGWKLQYATGINDSGVIVGYGRIGRRVHAFMLVPGSCVADINADGFVNADDYDAFVEAFVDSSPLADFNLDGFVNGDDHDLFAEAFDSGC